jgi:hypothetical protein
MKIVEHLDIYPLFFIQTLLLTYLPHSPTFQPLSTAPLLTLSLLLTPYSPLPLLPSTILLCHTLPTTLTPATTLQPTLHLWHPLAALLYSQHPALALTSIAFTALTLFTLKATPTLPTKVGSNYRHPLEGEYGCGRRRGARVHKRARKHYNRHMSTMVPGSDVAVRLRQMYIAKAKETDSISEQLIR